MHRATNLPAITVSETPIKAGSFNIQSTPNSMDSRGNIVFVLFLLLASVTAANDLAINDSDLGFVARQRGEQCRSKCRFIICRGRQTTLLGAPNKPSGPTICRRGQDIENIVSTNEALISGKGKRTPISKWRPEGLRKRFAAKYLFTKPLPGRGGLSGVVNLPAQANQHEFLDGKCVTIPIESYEKNVRGKISLVKTTSSKDCLSVQLVAPTIVIEAFWFSGDDMDLSVVEPGGEKIDNQDRFSECGQLIRDNNVDACGVFDSGGERIIYRLPCADGFDFKKGKYRAILRHSSNCQFGPTTYEVRVVVNGRLKKIVTGVSNKDGGDNVTSFTFNLP